VLTHDTIRIKPFIKWVGGKGQLINTIKAMYPVELNKKINRYCEPFIGGGAVLFDLLSNYEFDEIFINDVNRELINAYIMVRDDVDALMNILKSLQQSFISSNQEDRAKMYYNSRDRFNHLISINDTTIRLENAALFIFLNKTCFNGLYRVNHTGLFNVPIGRYKNPVIYNEDNMKQVSHKLENVIMNCGGYEECFKFINKHTFVYIDPPYRPISVTSNFTNYSKNIFDDSCQIKLSRFISDVNDKGAYIMLSNSDPKNTDDKDNFFDDLYKDYTINRVIVRRTINCNSKLRGNITELIITNYNNYTKGLGL